jgi:branched-subunit amino acid aminotransferase/4-amino-4-deoxychorismate lyase
MDSQDKVRVSLNGRGFAFADGVYEVIRSYSGRLFQLDELFLAGTTVEVIPVVCVNRREVGTGSPEPGHPTIAARLPGLSG